MVGAELPTAFLKSLGLKMENEWNGSWARAASLVLVTLLGLWIFGGHASLAGRSLTAIPRGAGLFAAVLGLRRSPQWQPLPEEVVDAVETSNEQIAA